MRRTTAASAALLALLAAPLAAQTASPAPAGGGPAPAPSGAQAPTVQAPGEKIIDVRTARPPAGNSFEALWSAFKKADAASDAEKRDEAWKEIRRVRIERNIRSLESVAMARIDMGLGHLAGGDRERATEDFRGAIGLDPYLPDGYFALAQADFKRGPTGIIQGFRDTVSGLTARLPTTRGQFWLLSLLVPSALLGLLAATAVLSAALLVRHGGLLLHDLEEALGSHRRVVARGIFVVLLLLPAMTFQGYGWLPFWWLALLFIYLSPVEKIVAGLLVACTFAVGPITQVLDARGQVERNPLFRAAILALEGGPDARAIADLEKARTSNLDDRDLSYLLATQYKKTGRYDAAAGVYREILQKEATDPVALNNLGNLEFANGDFPAAIARYRQGIEKNPSPELTATFQYNMSLAHLQRFEYQPAQEARAEADRLGGSLIKSYDNQWKYDKGDYAVVDLGLSRPEVLAKFRGAPSGIGLKNVYGTGGGVAPSIDLGKGILNRFAAFPLLAAAVIFALQRWRGAKAFTKRCLKCGTPFCRACHLGNVQVGLCTQCYHLFVVRDGVSGPARNQKLGEVQREDARRERMFRALSLLTPGAGHVYAQKTVVGLVFILIWSAILAVSLLAGRLIPVTEAPSTLAPPWLLAVGGIVLLAVYVMANRARPDFESMVMPPPNRAQARRRTA